MTLEHKAVVTCEKVATLEQFIDALCIRVDVFIREQGFAPGWEPDDADKTALQFLAVLDRVPIGTMRLRWTDGTSIKIERMAIRRKYRGMRGGTALTQQAVVTARQLGVQRLWLDAQSHARVFYERLGFFATTGDYCPWGIDVPHLTMEYQGWEW